MSIRITNLEEVALYNSSTDRAFGPVFYEGEEQAECYLLFLKYQTLSEPHQLTADELDKYMAEFQPLWDEYSTQAKKTFEDIMDEHDDENIEAAAEQQEG